MTLSGSAIATAIPGADRPYRFNGPDYEADADNARLTGQILRVFDLMRDGVWRTLGEISEATEDPQSSVSAQLRHLRKERFGAHTVNKRRRGNRDAGLFEYQLITATSRAAVDRV